MTNNLLLGAIVGDVCGSWYEFDACKEYDKINLYLPQSSFTDDTIGTIATAYALMNNISFTESYQYWFRKYNAKGCGHLFRQWVYLDNPKPYGSWGNGSAMRVSPVAYVAKNEEECLKLAEKSAECTHNSKEGIKGAQLIAKCIYINKLMWSDLNKYDMSDAVRNHIRSIIKFSFVDDLKECYPKYVITNKNKIPNIYPRKLDKIRPNYHFDSSCQGSVPVAIISFLESESYEDCIIKAISMGGDADTLAAMAGSIAYAHYGEMSDKLANFVLEKLPKEFVNIIEQFDKFVYSFAL